MTFGNLIGAIAFIVSLIILWEIKTVLLLLFAAIAFATVLNRMVRRLQRSGLKRGVAIALTIGLLFAIIGLFFILIFPTVVAQFKELLELLPQTLAQLREWYRWLQNIIPDQFIKDIQNREFLAERIPNISLSWFGGFFNIFSNSLDFVLNLLLVLVLIIMLLANPALYRQSFMLIFPAFYRRRVDEILQGCEKNIVGWAIGRIFNMVFIAIVSGIGLWVIGVPLALVNAIISALLSYIPNLGPILGSIPPIALAFIDSPVKGVIVIAFYLAIEQLEGLVLTPMIMENEISLPPAVTLTSMLIFSQFFGLLGLFLALPIVAVLQVWLKELLVKDVMNDWTLQGAYSPKVPDTLPGEPLIKDSEP
ncbi:AI-2E family transporter [Laspinema olomoucense]|uniref:AI-2E family transporter n=1 Tax=Laspinema olomoucense D3b TaxID=2953688 RepID=A0ABT2N1W2_9CYAN|nr:AI-2E family transporter [Laspinema sp. D3b]MCT7976674.1 AI-2E family transporter [Laspinema sp. D3b]